MNKIVKVFILCLSILFIQSTIFYATEVQAAEKTMYVKAKGDIILREKPTKDAKRIGTIKNYSSVKVISTSKEWSYVNTGNKKGYVYKSALVSKNPKVITTVTGGLTPKHGLTLTYSPTLTQREGKDTVKVRRDGSDIYLTGIDGSSSFLYFEDKNGINLGVYETDWLLFMYMYPMKEGKNAKEKFQSYDSYGPTLETANIFVESTSKTVKVKAGTFENVVILKNEYGYRCYLAPNIGVIKVTDKAGKIVTELISVK